MLPIVIFDVNCEPSGIITANVEATLLIYKVAVYWVVVWENSRILKHNLFVVQL